MKKEIEKQISVITHIYGVTKSQIGLSDFTFTFYFHALEKDIATHSSVFAWRIPGTGEPGGLLSMGWHRARHDWRDLAPAAAAASRDLLEFLEGEDNEWQDTKVWEKKSESIHELEKSIPRKLEKWRKWVRQSIKVKIWCDKKQTLLLGEYLWLVKSPSAKTP